LPWTVELAKCRGSGGVASAGAASRGTDGEGGRRWAVDGDDAKGGGGLWRGKGGRGGRALAASWSGRCGHAPVTGVRKGVQRSAGGRTRELGKGLRHGAGGVASRGFFGSPGVGGAAFGVAWAFRAGGGGTRGVGGCAARGRRDLGGVGSGPSWVGERARGSTRGRRRAEAAAMPVGRAGVARSDTKYARSGARRASLARGGGGGGGSGGGGVGSGG